MPPIGEEVLGIAPRLYGSRARIVDGKEKPIVCKPILNRDGTLT